MNLMRKLLKKRAFFLLVLGLALTWGVGGTTDCDAQDNHAEHDHAAHADAPATQKDHAGHDHAAHADDDHDAPRKEHVETDDHAGHDHAALADEGEGLRLSLEQRKRFGIVIATAGPGRLSTEVRLQGEVVFNEERVAHVVPRVAGITHQVTKKLGDVVKGGDVLAIIDSAELAEAKLSYFAAATEVNCCQFELPRAQAIHDNTLKMLALLNTSPSVDQLRDAAPGEMGDYRSKLITSYAEFILTEKAYAREKALLEKKISSEGDFLEAENAFKKATAEYIGTRDSVAYAVKQNLLETGRTQQLAALGAQTAAQRLRMFGLSEAEIAALGAAPHGGAATDDHVCTDPNCQSCKDSEPPASPLAEKQPGLYAIKAPFDGVIVEKHITLGERVSEDSDIFTIVDMSEVWVNLAVYTKDLATVRRGTDILLRADHSGVQAHGTVAAVTAFVEKSTRSATARVVLDNRDGNWIPGTFASGYISTSEQSLPVVVPRDAVQTIGEREIVFTEHEGAFEMTPVTLGRADRVNVEVTAGLKPGMRFVSKGAFQLKATVVTSNLGSHAGHGH